MSVELVCKHCSTQFCWLCRDSAGEDGACLLQEDELCITLLPGPPAALVADCIQQLECGSRGLLDVLPLKCVDCYGNIVENATFEVRSRVHGGVHDVTHIYLPQHTQELIVSHHV